MLPCLARLPWLLPRPGAVEDHAPGFIQLADLATLRSYADQLNTDLKPEPRAVTITQLAHGRFLSSDDPDRQRPYSDLERLIFPELFNRLFYERRDMTGRDT